MSRPSQPLRYMVSVAVILGAATLLLTLLKATDAALSVWDRLRAWPDWVGIAFVVLLLLLMAVAGWGVWRLLRPPQPRAPRADPIDRTALEQRIERLGDVAPETFEARSELAELDRRRAEGAVQICLFGQISTGKSSLLRALAPESAPRIGVVGGTTTAITHHHGTLPDGRKIDIADVPGSAEAGDTAHLQLAAAEAARSHALVYVVDADLTRRQANELAELARFSRPIIIALNKADRFDAEQTHALVERLRQHAAPWQAQVVAVSAGFEEEIEREHPDGRRDTVIRQAPSRIDMLQRALERVARLGATALEPGREAALLSHVDARVAEGERRVQCQQSDAAIDKYTRRAVLGALAAVAPGTDLVIQGALATALTRELCQIHGLRPRDVDIDDLLGRAGGLLRTGTSITLAVVGNALKAFPGFGTLGGGLVHAVAYGLIFDSLGHALADTLANTCELDRDATLDAFGKRLASPSTDRLLALARIALDNQSSKPSTGD
ncbi:GTPase domain-containing protein [Xanthomonadaceae bacterium JHOS43]|nr:GTPase domain-containing protein [Xanthomonadaceae bacterium JHOS43]